MTRGAVVAAALASSLLAAGCSEPAQPLAVASAPLSSREILTELSRWDAATRESRRAAAEDVAGRLPEFALSRMETFSCGGQTHEVAIYAHAKTGLEFVLVPGGTFEMGSPAGELGRSPDETSHSVVLPGPFLIARTPCTQAAYERIAGENPSWYKGPDRPVEQVSWNDAVAFCERAGLALPTEAEWEFACRAGTTTAYYFGDADADLGGYAWYESNSNSRDGTHLVGQKMPNAFGLFDMSGNVMQWCANVIDVFPSGHPIVLTDSKRTFPRAIRGGSWRGSAEFQRSAHRARSEAETSIRGLGFRPIRRIAADEL